MSPRVAVESVAIACIYLCTGSPRVSADEIIAALLSAEALGYIEMEGLEGTLDLLDRVPAML